MDITMEVSTNAGIFYKHDPFNPNSPMLPAILQIFNQFYGQHFTVDIDKKLYWEPEGFDYEYMAEQIEKGNLDYNSAHKEHDYVDNPSFIDVTIRADEYIVGYCVIAIREINENDGHPDQEFSFEVLTIVNFPEVNGKMQKVKFSYVQDQIFHILLLLLFLPLLQCYQYSCLQLHICHISFYHNFDFLNSLTNLLLHFLHYVLV